MNPTNYTRSFTVQAAPEAVYRAINNVTGWWTINFEGRSEKVGDEFTVQFEDAGKLVHRTTQRIVASEPGRRVVWRVTEALQPWLKDREEWKGTEVVFAIDRSADGTTLTVTHMGLTAQAECFDQCEKGWDYFIGVSLYKLVSEGVGQPDTTQRTHLDSIGHVHPTNA